VITALVGCLAMFCQAGDMRQLELVARNMLAAIPDDIVALQFLGLALYGMGRIDDSYRAFKRVAAQQDRPEAAAGGVCETAAAAILRTATQAHSGLAEGWYRIAILMADFGLHKPARRALSSALAAHGSAGLKS
jgi:hypothetical protein